MKYLQFTTMSCEDLGHRHLEQVLRLQSWAATYPVQSWHRLHPRLEATISSLLLASTTWTLLITLSGMVSDKTVLTAGSTEFTLTLWLILEGTFMELLTTSQLLFRPLTAEVTFSDGPLITLDIMDEADVDDADELVEAGMAIMPEPVLLLAAIIVLVGLIWNEHANW